MAAPYHFQRALALQEQGRHDMAEKELRLHLAEAPDDGIVHASLALSLLEQEKLDEAQAAAVQAVGLTPDIGFTHYMLARVFIERNMDKEAQAAVEEAVRIDPEDADYHATKSQIELSRGRWAEALASAETGLSFESEHVGCNNLRAIALVKLGRKKEATATIQATLSRDPENSVSHANQGWTFLEQGERKKALHHFKESLRLDPGNDWARSGLVEAIKAGNPIYALLLKYILWSQKLSERGRWAVIMGGFLFSRLLGVIKQSSPPSAVWVNPLLAVYIIFALMTWLGQPIFNLSLFLHPLGRHALSRDQKSQAVWVGGCIGFALVALALWLALDHDPVYLVHALVFGLMTLPVSAVFSCQTGWPRRTMVGITIGLGVLGLAGLAMLTASGLKKSSALTQPSLICLGAFLIGALLCEWFANWLFTRRARR